MTADTAAALHRINLAFYRRHAAEFSATREQPWGGWQRLLGAIEATGGEPLPSRLRVLDLGCGNGRLARFLEKRWRRVFDYHGVDASGELLDIARQRYAGARGRSFHQHDLLLGGWSAGLAEQRFDLVAAFGLLHHLPGADNRRRLLASAAERLSAGGLLAVSFWQFGEEERFEVRRVGWAEHNRTAAEPIDEGDLEPGDTLLAWGDRLPSGGRRPVRYCHWTTPAEADRLLVGLPLSPVASFRADGASGRLNLYHLLRRPSSA